MVLIPVLERIYTQSSVQTSVLTMGNTVAFQA